jgi:dTDP-4-dehydrorhamnose reductase
MILLLGATGYIGRAFARELTRREWPFHALSRGQVDYSRFETLLEWLRSNKPSCVINAAGFTGRPNVDACETAQADTLQGNTLLPLTIADACAATGTPWGHVSSGCIYSGAQIVEGGCRTIERDLTKPGVRALVDRCPSAILGFTEEDEPNFTFRSPPCSFYSGTKALAEEVLRQHSNVFLWRLRIPFDEVDGPKNYLSKLLHYDRLYDNVNSISHRGDFVRACLDLWERRAPFGTYNVTNRGFVSTRQVVALIQKILKPARSFEYFASDGEFYRLAARAPRCNCVLDVSKLLATGVKLRPVEEALIDALKQWRQEKS